MCYYLTTDVFLWGIWNDIKKKLAIILLYF